MRKGDARREELLSTAERLFCAKGYEGTSVQDIIDEKQSQLDAWAAAK